MEYMLLIHADGSKLETLPQEAKSQALAAYGAYTEALNKAGIVRSSNRLRPGNTATTVRVREGKTEVLNGPGRRRGAAQLRQAGRFPVRPHPRCSRGRGRLVRSLRHRLGRLAAARCSGQPRGLAAGGGAPQTAARR